MFPRLWHLSLKFRKVFKAETQGTFSLYSYSLIYLGLQCVPRQNWNRNWFWDSGPFDVVQREAAWGNLRLSVACSQPSSNMLTENLRNCLHVRRNYIKTSMPCLDRDGHCNDWGQASRGLSAYWTSLSGAVPTSPGETQWDCNWVLIESVTRMAQLYLQGTSSRPTGG